MAVTVTRIGVPNVAGNLRVGIFQLAFDASYPTGGEALTPADLGLSEIDVLIAEPAGGYTFEYDHTNEKLLARWVDTTTDGAPQAQVADTTDLSGVTGVRIIAFGR